MSRFFFPLLAVLALATTDVRAQEPDSITDRGPRVIEGRVAMPVGDSLRGVAGVWVVLHRVGNDTAGPVDSTQTGVRGAYRIAYRQLGDDRTIYFVSAQYAGIAYFSPPMPPEGATEDDAELIVYDTASTGIPLRVQGRHVVLSAAGVDGMRDIVEIYEIANETDRTLVSPDDSLPTWSGTLPPGATEIRIGEGDVSEDAVRVSGQRLDVLAPIAPGLKSFSLAYRLSADAFPLRLPIDSPVVSLEVLLEDPNVSVDGAGLAPTEPVNIEGRLFRRFAADSVPAGAAIRATIPALGKGRRTVYVAIVLIAFMAAMLVALARAFGRRGSVGALPSAAPPPRSADSLAREIAALDAEFERSPPTDREMRDAVAARRAALKDALTRALAAEQGRR